METRVKSQKHFYLDGLFDKLNEGISQLDRDKVKALRDVSTKARADMMDILDGYVPEVKPVEPVAKTIVLDEMTDASIHEAYVEAIAQSVEEAIKQPVKRNRGKKVVDNG